MEFVPDDPPAKSELTFVPDKEPVTLFGKNPVMDILSKIVPAAANIGGGVLDAGAGALGAPGQLYNLVGDTAEAMGSQPYPDRAPEGADVKKFFSKLMPGLSVYEGQEPWEKGLRAGARGVYSTPGGLPMKMLGAISGASGEYAADRAEAGPNARDAGQAPALIAGVAGSTPDILRAGVSGAKALLGLGHVNPLEIGRLLLSGGADTAKAAARALASAIIQHGGAEQVPEELPRVRGGMIR